MKGGKEGGKEEKVVEEARSREDELELDYN
jgi:hypothetical protein